MKHNFIMLIQVVIAVLFCSIDPTFTEESEKMEDQKIDYEREYSPHFWTDKQGGLKVLEDYIQLITEISDRARESVPREELRYGFGARQIIDLYGGDTLPKDAPILMFLHGGYWQLLDKNITAVAVHPLWKHGIRVAVVGFDLAPEVTVGDIIKEIREACAFILNYAKENNSSKVWVLGHSVGGHLGASLLTDGSWLKEEVHSLLGGLILAAGLYDIRPVVHTTHNNKLNMTLAQAEKWSPLLEKKIAAEVVDDFRVLVYVGDKESPEWIRQNRQYANLLTKQGVKSEFHLLPGIDHFDIASNLQYEDFILTRTVISHLKSGNSSATDTGKPE